MKNEKKKRTHAVLKTHKFEHQQGEKHQAKSENANTSKNLLTILKSISFKKLFKKSSQDNSSRERKQSEGFKLKNLLSFINFRKSLGMKIFIIFILSLFACVSIVGLSSYKLSKDTLKENIVTAGEATLAQVARNIDYTLNNYDDFTLQIMYHEDLLNNIDTYVTSVDQLEKMNATKKISGLLNTYIFSNDQMKNLAVIPMNQDVAPITAGTISNNVHNRINTSDYHKKEWFQNVVDKNGGSLWISSQEDGIVEANESDTIAIARLVTNSPKGNSFLLVVEFEVLDLFNATNRVEIINDSYIEVVDTSNKYIKAHENEQIAQDANFMVSEQLSGELKGSFQDKHKSTNNEYIVIYRQITNQKDWYVTAALPLSEIDKEISPIFLFTLSMMILAIVLAVIIGVVILRMVSRPLTQISAVMTKGAEGDLTVRAPIKNREDEIGVLANRFDEMMIQIENLAKQTTDSAQKVLTTAVALTQASHKTSIAGKEISIATDEIAAGASALAVEAEKGADLTSNMTNQMNQVNSSRQQMIVSANQVDEASEQGLVYMSGLIERTGETEKMVGSMVSKVNALSESTKSIVKILDVLNNVTKQTNILSLNATIEAARAGQAGKGFMVVADEIRQLADQSRQSIQVVADITDTISQEIMETVTVLQQAQPLFTEQIVSVKDANQLFVTVRSQMDTLKVNIDEVSHSFDQLSDTQITLTESMNNVSAVAEQSSATSEEVASLSSEQLLISEHLVELSSELESVSEQLKVQLSKFKING